MSRIITTEIFKKQIIDKFEGIYTILGEYKNKITPIKIKCNRCNNIYEITPSSLLYKNNGTCKYCAARKNTKQFKKEIYDLVGDEYTVLGEYTKNKNKILMKHNKCGHEYETTPINFLGLSSRKGRRCPYCANRYQTTEDFKNRIHVLVGDEYTVLGEYQTADTKILMKHNKCGHKYEVRAGLFLYNKRRCPNCCPTRYGSSYKEKNLQEFIKSIYFNKIENNKRFYYDIEHPKKYYELDIYIPELNIGIEFDGLVWHSESKKEKYNLLHKMELFNDLDINVINIFEDEWDQKQEIVKAKLKHILNVSEKNKIYARKTILHNINNSQKRQFLDDYHIQGNDNSSIKYGLFYNDKIVAVMTFSKLRKVLGHKSIENHYELSRFATSENVIGGFSKLFKNILKLHPEIHNIKTYADLRWSFKNTNVYNVNNFKLLHISKPGYFYCNNDTRFHRFNFRKNILQEKFPDIYNVNLTEFQIMDMTKYYRLWDCGNLVYEYKIKE